MFEALNKAREDEFSVYGFYKEETPRCPHCGNHFDIEENEAFELCRTDKDDLDITCDSCQQDFNVKIHTAFSYSTNESDMD